MHVALRCPKDKSIIVDGENVVPAVHSVLDKVINFHLLFIVKNVNKRDLLKILK